MGYYMLLFAKCYKKEMTSAYFEAQIKEIES